MIKLIINMSQKYNSSEGRHQEDAFKSARLLAIIAHQFLSKSRGIYKQFDSFLAGMTFYYQQNAAVMPAESVQRVKDLFQKFRDGNFPPEDTIILAGDSSSVPAELTKETARVDQMDCYEYKDGIDTDSLSFTFSNILQMFRVDFAVEIKVQAALVKIQE